jgi:Rieske Fe-S protein
MAGQRESKLCVYDAGLPVDGVDSGRRAAIVRIGSWVIYTGAVGAAGMVTACGRTPLGLPFDLGSTPTNTPTPTPSLTPTPTPTGTPGLCGDCSSVSGVDSGLKTTDLALNSVAYNSGQKIFLCRDATGYYAMSSNCSHSGCDIGMPGSGGGVFSPTNLASGFDCNCHGSQFHADGTVKQGPAGSPLLHYRLSVNGTKQIFIDKTPPFNDVSCRCPG